MSCLKIYKDKRECQKINSKIEKQIKKDRDKVGKKMECKVLMLGASGAGKSTFVKQMKIMHGGGFSRREQEDAKEIVLSNLVICVYIILCQEQFRERSDEFTKMRQYTKCLYISLTCAEKKEISIFTSIFVKPSSKDEGDTLCEKFEREFCKRYPGWSTWRKLLLSKIRHNEVFTSILLSLGPIDLPDSALYFLASFERLLRLDFLPTNEDIVRMRLSTTGVVEITVPFGDRSLRLVDVGGQRTERRKWIHCFEDVTSILFIASLSGYNVNLVEDKSQNRLEESIALFKTILDRQIFNHITMILFLNKKDIFEKKITSVDLKDTFTDYTGKVKDMDEAKQFILSKFVKNRSNIIYSHMTSAVDQSNVRHVFSAIKQTIFNRCIYDILRQGLF